MMDNYLSSSKHKICHFLLIWCFFISGCAPSISTGPERLIPISEEMAQLRSQTKLPDFDAYSELDSVGQMVKRNAYISKRMYGIDVAYSKYEASLTQERQTVGFGATSAAMGLSAAAGIVSPVTTKNILAGLSTGVLGAKAVYSDEVLAKQTIQILQTQMRTNRTKIGSMIHLRMRQDSVSYPLSSALSDIEAYYQAGTITGGLLGVNMAVSAEADTAATQKEITESIIANKSSWYDEAAIKIYTYMHPAGKLSPDRQKRLKDILRKDGQPDLASVLTEPSMADVRKKLAEKL